MKVARERVLIRTLHGAGGPHLAFEMWDPKWLNEVLPLFLDAKSPSRSMKIPDKVCGGIAGI